MRTLVAGSAARIAGGAGMVACAAIVALAAGGGSLFGGLGGLFGKTGTALQVARGSTAAAADIVAAPNAAQRAAVLRQISSRNAPSRVGSPRSHSRSHSPSTPPRTPAPQQPSPLQPIPGPAPVTPPPSPARTPGGGQTVSFAGETVKQVTQQAPPALQPVTKPLDDAVANAVKACQGLPACP